MRPLAWRLFVRPELDQVQTVDGVADPGAPVVRKEHRAFVTQDVVVVAKMRGRAD
jgi:hypothetical protein